MSCVVYICLIQSFAMRWFLKRMACEFVSPLALSARQGILESHLVMGIELTRLHGRIPAICLPLFGDLSREVAEVPVSSFVRPLITLKHRLGRLSVQHHLRWTIAKPSGFLTRWLAWKSRSLGCSLETGRPEAYSSEHAAYEWQPSPVAKPSVCLWGTPQTRVYPALWIPCADRERLGFLGPRNRVGAGGQGDRVGGADLVPCDREVDQGTPNRLGEKRPLKDFDLGQGREGVEVDLLPSGGTGVANPGDAGGKVLQLGDGMAGREQLVRQLDGVEPLERRALERVVQVESVNMNSRPHGPTPKSKGHPRGAALESTARCRRVSTPMYNAMLASSSPAL